MSAELYDPKSAYYDPTLGFDAQLDLSERKYDGFGDSLTDRRQQEQDADAWAVLLPLMEFVANDTPHLVGLGRAYKYWWEHDHQHFDRASAMSVGLDIVEQEVMPKFQTMTVTDKNGVERQETRQVNGCYKTTPLTMGRDPESVPDFRNAQYQAWDFDEGSPTFYPVVSVVLLPEHVARWWPIDGAYQYTDDDKQVLPVEADNQVRAYAHVFTPTQLVKVAAKPYRPAGTQVPVMRPAMTMPSIFPTKTGAPKFSGVFRTFKSHDSAIEWFDKVAQARNSLSRARVTAIEPELSDDADLTVEEVTRRPVGTR